MLPWLSDKPSPDPPPSARKSGSPPRPPGLPPVPTSSPHRLEEGVVWVTLGVRGRCHGTAGVTARRVSPSGGGDAEWAN